MSQLKATDNSSSVNCIQLENTEKENIIIIIKKKKVNKMLRVKVVHFNCIGTIGYNFLCFQKKVSK